MSQLQQPTDSRRLNEILFGSSGVFGQGDPGFVEGQSNALDWLNLGIGGDSFVGPILGLLSRQSAASDAQRRQNQANAANERRYSEILGLNTQAQNTAQGQLNETGQFYANRVPQVQAEFDRAGQDIGRVGETARRDILSAGRAAQGAAAQQSRRQGLTNSTINRAGQYRSAVDTQRSLADLGERVAGLRGNLGAQRASTLAGTTGDLGRFMQNRTGFETGLLADRAGAIERRTDQVDLRDLIPALMNSRGTGGGSSSRSNGIGNLIGSVLGGLF